MTSELKNWAPVQKKLEVARYEKNRASVVRIINRTQKARTTYLRQIGVHASLENVH